MSEFLNPQNETSRLRALLIALGVVLVACSTTATAQRKQAAVHPAGADYRVIPGDSVVVPTGAKRVLFVGNSHLYFNAVPHSVQQLATGPPLAFDSLTSPAKSLAWHAEKGDVARWATKTEYDVVVLQPNSLELLDGVPREAVAKLEAQANGAPILVMQTWPRDPTRDDVARSWGAMNDWNTLVMKNAKALGYRVAPVGRVWMCVYRETGLDLWDPDGNHSSPAGAFVAALTLHRSVYGSGATWSEFVPMGVAPLDAIKLRKTTDACLRDRDE